MKKTVLIVDDYKLFRQGFRSFLEMIPEIGVIMEANNGDSAITISKEHHPQLIFMDIGMPKNGLDAVENIHKVLPDIKIIILTVYTKKSIVEKAIKIGACGYLLKKSVNQELLKALKTIDLGSRYISHHIKVDLDFMNE